MIFTYRIDVQADTHEQAEKVMYERTNYDEDYGFEYTLNDPIFFGMGTDRPPQGVIEISGRGRQWTRESPSEIAAMLHAETMHFWVHVIRGANYERMLINKNDVKTVENYS